MKHITILLGVCLLVLCTAPVHALYAGNDDVHGWWCPMLGYTLEGDILWNDIPNTPPIRPVIVEDAKYGTVTLLSGGRVHYEPYSNHWDINHAFDSFRYRTFDGQDYSNVADVMVAVWPYMNLKDGKFLKFSTPKDTMLTAQIEDDLVGIQWAASAPEHGTLTLDYREGSGQTPYFHYMPDPGFEGIDRMEYSIVTDTLECDLMWGMPGTIEITVGNPNPIPEFLSTVLPMTFVIGFLGAVLLIRSTREQ